MSTEPTTELTRAMKALQDRRDAALGVAECPPLAEAIRITNEKMRDPAAAEDFNRKAFSGLDIDLDEVETFNQALFGMFITLVMAGGGHVQAITTIWLDGLATGILLERQRRADSRAKVTVPARGRTGGDQVVDLDTIQSADGRHRFIRTDYDEGRWAVVEYEPRHGGYYSPHPDDDRFDSLEAAMDSVRA